MKVLEAIKHLNGKVISSHKEIYELCKDTIKSVRWVGSEINALIDAGLISGGSFEEGGLTKFKYIIVEPQMTASELIEISKTAPAGNALRNAAAIVEKMVSLIGDHEIPSTNNEYADLIDSRISDDRVGFDEMMVAASIITHKKMAVDYMSENK